MPAKCIVLPLAKEIGLPFTLAELKKYEHEQPHFSSKNLAALNCLPKQKTHEKGPAKHREALIALMVPEAGLEPARCCQRQILSLREPFSILCISW